MINIKGNKKMFYREMSLWAPWTGFLSRYDQDWLMSRSNNPVLEVDSCFHAGFFLALFFYLEDGGDIFLRNII
jgi:hypothetical protein